MVYEIEIRDASGVEICRMVKINGVILSQGSNQEETIVSILDNLKDMKIRDDDVMLCTPVKSGNCLFVTVLQIVFPNYKGCKGLNNSLDALSCLQLTSGALW